MNSAKTINIDAVELELADRWAELERLGTQDPEQLTAAVKCFQEACRQSDHLTADQGERLAEHVAWSFGPLLRALEEGRSLESLSVYDDGYECLTALNRRQALRRLIMGAVAGATLVSTVATSNAAPSFSHGPDPEPIVMELVVDVAIRAAEESSALPGLPSGAADLFERSMSFTAKWEGGFSDHVADRGGATKYGVTQGLLDAVRERDGEPPMDVRDLTKDQALEIYRSEFWIPCRCDKLPERVAMWVLDTAVNSGMYRAIKMLQAEVGAKADGKLGPKSLAKVHAQDPHDLFNRLIDARAKFVSAIVEKDQSQSVFLKGWENRIYDMRVFADARGFETIEQFGSHIQRWWQLLKKNPATDDPVGHLSDNDFPGVPV